MSADSAAPGGGAPGPTKFSGKRARGPWLLVLLLLLGAGLRGAYAVERVAAADFEHPAVDAGFHDAWARVLAGLEAPTPGLRQLEQRPYLRPPGYPFFLAGVYRLSGGSRTVAMLVQAALGLLAGLLTFRVGRRWFGDAVGWLAAGLVLVNWTLIYFEGELHAPALLIVLLLGSLDLLGHWWASGSRGAAFLAGLLLGLAALVRPNVLLFAVAVAGWMAWGFGPGPPGARWRAARLPLLCLATGLALAVAPVTVRNYRVAGDAVLISSNGGVNLYIGNHERATGRVAGHLPGLGRFETCYDYPRIVERVERQVGRPLSDSEVSAWFARQAWGFASQHPAQVLGLTLHKARLFWGPQEVAHNKDLALERAASGVLRRLPGPFPWTALLAVVGLCAAAGGLGSRRRAGAVLEPTPDGARAQDERRGAWLLGLCVGALFLSVLPFFAAARYRVPLIPVLCVLAAVGLIALWNAWSDRRFAVLGLLLASGAVAGALFSVGAPRAEPNVAKWHLDRARALRRSGDEEGAAREARLTLVLAPEDPEAHFLLGNALGASGDAAGAERHYRSALARRPHDHRVLNNLGSVLAERGDYAGAVAAFEGALARDPEPAPVHYNLGLSLERDGRGAAAVEHYRRALELRPGWSKARRALERVRALPTEDEQATLPR